jgi:AcrR family transcriptional regulator
MQAESPKTAQILQGALQVFLVQGFDGASMDDIAQAAQVSKATIYAHFSDKNALFIESIRGAARGQSDLIIAMDRLEIPLPDALAEIGMHFLEVILGDQALRLHGVCMAESERFPMVARIYFESGPAHAARQLAQLLAVARERGEFTDEGVDLELAAWQFFEVCKGGLFYRALMLGPVSVTPEEMQTAVDAGVRLFLRAYGRA